MCGIVGATASRKCKGILVEGLKRLEYRGYDSAGIAIIDGNNIQVRKTVGKVAELENAIATAPVNGPVGIAHTRWATHGKPTTNNAHPHTSQDIAVVHNGIIENHDELRANLKADGYSFVSQTDTEVIAHLIHRQLKTSDSLLDAVQKTVAQLDGAYALGVVCARFPDVVIGARSGSPLVVGVGFDENFIASDQMALRPVTDRFIFLDEGDFVEITTSSVKIVDQSGTEAKREIVQLTDADNARDKGEYRHFMMKEIFEQPAVLADALSGRIGKQQVLAAAFGPEADALFSKTKAVHIIACGTSYHAGMVAKYWLEELAGISCHVEVASEYRYRKVVVPQGALFVTISQSGETADTLAALRKAKNSDYLGFVTICNVPSSSLVRESDLALMTKAGAEIGVASTKAFTTQLVALQLFTLALGHHNGVASEKEAEMVAALHKLPKMAADILQLNADIKVISERFVNKHHALFLGRGAMYPVALEGALKLKEISYIHAEAYPSGELKHGPLALVDDDMPVIAVAPNNELLEKLKSNLHEVKARGGELYVFADTSSGFQNEDGMTVINMPHVAQNLEAILYTLPLQLLSYHVAVLRGTDVDQPRNLAKSVTVE